MKITIYDPLPMGNEYATKMFFRPMREFAKNNGIPCTDLVTMADVRDSTVVVLTDHLSEGLIQQLKNNGNRIVGFNITDSSYISGAIRYATSLPLVNLIFMVSGVPTTNEGSELAVSEDFQVTTVPRPFLDEHAWGVFDGMRKMGKLKSLPYIPWTPIPEVKREPWAARSKKAIIRGGGHARRILLAMFLMRHDKLDTNSGFHLAPYFAEDMNPQFRFCDDCRADYKQHHRARILPVALGCNSPARAYGGPDRIPGEFHPTRNPHFDLGDLGQWNNRCPRSFYWMAEQFQKVHGPIDMAAVETMLNVRWIHPDEYLKMLGRILYTSDLKWEHSIFKPQRFWEAASAGCMNVLPMRTMNQEYFPKTLPGVHYMVFEETMQHLELAFDIDEKRYDDMAREVRSLYDEWIKPSIYSVNTNLLAHIFEEMRKL